MAGLLVLAPVVPFLGLVAVFLAGGRWARPLALCTLGAGIVVAGGIVMSVAGTREALEVVVGGWAPPLGIRLRADGLSAVMLLLTAVVTFLIGVFADFPANAGRETREGFAFWFLLLGVTSGLQAAFVGQDLFNLYVALELMTFAAVPMVCLQGSAKTYQAALRYLIFALIGSVLYLLGAVLFYAAYGSLDLAVLAGRVEPGLVVSLAVAVMTVGLAAKTALFPLHLWLPAAHASAPPAASAVLSALVIKGSFFLTVRLWCDVVPGLLAGPGAQLLGGLGAGAVVFGGVMALRQDRLKLLIAYSTVAQIGYLFLLFPVGLSATALAGGMFQAVAHALAKAALFLAAGLLVEGAESDTLRDLRGAGRGRPLILAAFALAALSLIGVPPTGGFVAKWLLLAAAVSSGQILWALVVLIGGLLAGGYLFRALRALVSSEGVVRTGTVSLRKQAAVVALAFGALAVGLFPQGMRELLAVGRPVTAEVNK